VKFRGGPAAVTGNICLRTCHCENGKAVQQIQSRKPEDEPGNLKRGT